MTRRGVTTERLAALFLLGVAAFTPPWLGIFNSPLQVFGVPLLYLYLFAAWAALIGLTALVVDAGRTDEAFSEPPAGSDADTSERRGEP